MIRFDLLSSAVPCVSRMLWRSGTLIVAIDVSHWHQLVERMAQRHNRDRIRGGLLLPSYHPPPESFARGNFGYGNMLHVQPNVLDGQRVIEVSLVYDRWFPDKQGEVDEVLMHAAGYSIAELFDAIASFRVTGTDDEARQMFLVTDVNLNRATTMAGYTLRTIASPVVRQLTMRMSEPRCVAIAERVTDVMWEAHFALTGKQRNVRHGPPDAYFGLTLSVEDGRIIFSIGADKGHSAQPSEHTGLTFVGNNEDDPHQLFVSLAAFAALDEAYHDYASRS